MWSAAASKVEEAGDAQRSTEAPSLGADAVTSMAGWDAFCRPVSRLLSYLSYLILHASPPIFNKISQLSQRSIFRRAEGVPPGALRAPHASCSRPESPPLTALAV